MEIISLEGANEIMEAFKLPGIEWIELASYRSQAYSDIVKNGNRIEISKVANTLIRKEHETQLKGKKMNGQDTNLLNNIKNH